MRLSKYESRPLGASEIVAAALYAVGGRQKTLADLVGKGQPTISKYRSGVLEPPTGVLLRCLEISGLWSPSEVSANELAERVSKELEGDQYTAIRRTICELLNAVTRQPKG